MRRAAILLALTFALALPARAATFDPAGADLSQVTLSGVRIGQSLDELKAARPKLKVSFDHDAKQKAVIVGGRAVFNETVEGAKRNVTANLTLNNEVLSVEVVEQVVQTPASQPEEFVNAWIKQYGPPTSDVDFEDDSVEDKDRTVYLSWFDVPRRNRVLSISLQYERLGECATVKPEGLDCAEHKWAYGKFEGRYLFKDRQLEFANRNAISRVLRAVAAAGAGKKKKK